MFLQVFMYLSRSKCFYKYLCIYQEANAFTSMYVCMYQEANVFTSIYVFIKKQMLLQVFMYLSRSKCFYKYVCMYVSRSKCFYKYLCIYQGANAIHTSMYVCFTRMQLTLYSHCVSQKTDFWQIFPL